MSIRIPVLMYHEIAAEGGMEELRRRTHPDYILPVNEFEEQMRFLAEAGYHTPAADEVVKAVAENSLQSLPERPLLITFDDGFSGNHEHALPILSRYKLRAAFFVTISQIGTPSMMTWSQLQKLQQAGMGVYSHLMHHVIMSELSREEAFFELEQSRHTLIKRLGTPVDLLSLPNGSYHKDYAHLAHEAGYAGGFSSRLGYVRDKSNPFLLERIPVLRQTSQARFAGIVAGKRHLLTSAKIRRHAHTFLNRVVGESVVNHWYHKINHIVAPHSENQSERVK